MAKRTGTDFRPPRPWGWFITLAALLNRVLLARHTTVDIRPADLVLLRALPPGCLIAPNHAHYADPQVTFELARRGGRRVIYMAAREVFDAWGGWAGWFAQHLGAFSVNRGGANVEAQQVARSVLVAGTYDLLMFPEGEIYLLNDLVMPLKPGVARLALEAANELVRQGLPRRILILPVAIKYRFTGDITAALDATAARIEAHVLGQPSVGPLYPRIVAVGTELLARAERAHGVTPDPREGLYERVRRLRRSLLERLERKHLGEVREGFDFDRARKLMIRIQGLLPDAGGGSGYYGPPRALPADPFTQDLEAARLCARSVAFQDDYLLHNPTPERMAETLVKLEREVLGREIRAPLGRRRAVIRLAPPLDVQEFLPGRGASSALDDTIEAIVIRLHEALQGILDAIDREEDQERAGTSRN